MRYPDFKALLIVSIALGVSACGDSDGLSVVDPLPGQGQHTPHTGVEQGIWPPQPLGMTSEEGFPASAREGAQTNVQRCARSSHEQPGNSFGFGR